MMKIKMPYITSSKRRLVAGGLVTAGVILAIAFGTTVFRRSVQYRVSQTAVANGTAPDPVANGITVVTYNTHLFKGSSSEVGFCFRNMAQNIKRFFSDEGPNGKCTAPIVFDDDNRARLIADKIKTSGADIVGLQEVWSYRRQKWFCRELASVYPYSCYPTHPTLALRTTSGLVLLSRYSLTDLSFSRFSRKGRPFFNDENWASKGVLTATVEAYPGGPTFRIGISHACTDVGGSSQPNIRQLASQTTTSHKGPAIMMGDLNVGATDAKYEKMRDIFEDVRATDAYRKLHKVPDENAFTVNWGKNPLHRKFSHNAGEGKCLDYVFVKESGRGLTLIPEHAEVIRDWNYPAAASQSPSQTIPMDLSDHYPVKINFSAQRQ